MYDIAGARSQGFSDDDLVSHLAQSGKVPFDFPRAREAGYSSKEILDAIDARQQAQRTQRQAAGVTEPGHSSGVAPALAQGGADVLSGAGETLKQYTPFNSAGDMLKQAAGKIAPTNYDRAHLVDENGVNASKIPQVAAEAAPGAAVGITAARLAGKRFGLPGALLGGLATYYLQNVGNRAKERAAYRTGDENADTTLGDKTTAALATIPEAAVGGAAATRFLPGAGRMANVGMRGVMEAGGKLATTAAVEGAAGGAQNAIAQTGRTLGTEPGFKFDPTEAANAAATGATLAPVFGGVKAARDVNTSIKYRDIDPATARRVANDISTSAEGGAEALSSTKTGYNAVNDTAKNYATDLQTSVNALKRETGNRPLPGEAEGVVRRAANGRALTERDISILENTAAGTQSGPAVVELARKINTLARLKKTGSFGNENFVGGAGHAMERALPVLGQPVKGAAYAGLALTGASHAGLLIPSAGALGGLLGAYGGARLLDKAMGTRSPAKSFVDRFGGPVPPGPSPVIPGAFNPTGPRVPPQRPMAQPWGSPGAPTPPPAAPIPGFPWGTAPPTNPTGPRMGQTAQAAYNAGTPPGRGPIQQPAPNMPLLGRGPGAVIQQPQTPQLRLPPPARAQLPDVANRSAYEPEVRALLTAANARAKSKAAFSKEADGYMQRMLSDQPEPDITAPVAKPTAETKQAKLVASALKKAKAPSAPTEAPAAAAVVTAPTPRALPQVETPQVGISSGRKVDASPVATTIKTRLASPLATRMAAQHNTEVTRKPVETKPQVKRRDKPLSMAEQLNEDAVHEAIKGGAKSAKDVISKAGEDPEDRQSLRATLNRMIAEGSVSFEEKKVAAEAPKSDVVPPAVRAKAKMSAKAAKAKQDADEVAAMYEAAKMKQVEKASRFAPEPVKAPEAPKSTVVPFKQPQGPARDQWDAVLDVVRAKAKAPSRVEDLDAERRSRMAANKDAAERGRAALAQVQKTPEVAKRVVNEDPWAIPDFARRTKGEAPKAEPAPVPKPVLTEAVRAADKAAEAEGPKKSPHYKKDNLDATVKAAQAEYGSPTGNGYRFKESNPASFEKALGTIDRIIREKDATAKQIEKEIPGFDFHDFNDRYIHSRSHDEGRALVEYIKKKHPEYTDVFERHLTPETFGSIYPGGKKKKK